MTAQSERKANNANLYKNLFAISFALLALRCRLHADPLAETQARFGVVTGDVGLLPQGAPEWIEPHEGLPIELGDQIRTGEDGHVEILLSENALWVLEPESDFSTERMDTRSGRFNLSSGTLLGLVDSARAAGVPQLWEFNTPAALASIQGTQFALIAARSQGTQLGVFEGSVEFAPAETAEGLQPPVHVVSGQEAMASRKRSVRILTAFSPALRTLAAKVPGLRRRQIQIENTWSPYTVTVRADLRKKFVAPPPKVKPRTVKRRVIKKSSASNSVQP